MSQLAVIRATLKYKTQDELIRGMTPLISKHGLFIHTRTTRPVGSEVHFEFKLADGSITYSGEGIVRKEVPFVGGPSSQKSGMLVSLKRINRPFKEVVDSVLGSTPSSKMSDPKLPAACVNIVESQAGKSKGLDIFGDMDFEAGLDSLFSSIKARHPSAPVIETNLYDHPTVVSGLFVRPQLDADVVDIGLAEDDMFEEDDLFQVTAAPEPASKPQNDFFSGAQRANINNLEKTQAKTGEFEQAVENIVQTERVIAQATRSGDFSVVGAEDLKAVLDTPTGEMDAVEPEESRGGDATLEMAPSPSMVNHTIVDPYAQDDITTGSYPQPKFDDKAANEPAKTAQTAEVRKDAVSLFPSTGAEETPSELFAALHEDMWNEPSEEPVAAAVAVPVEAPKAEAPKAEVQNVQPASAPVEAPVEIPVYDVVPEQALAEETPEQAPPILDQPIEQSEIISQEAAPTPSAPFDMMSKVDGRSSQDIIMSDVTVKKAQSRRRERPVTEAPVMPPPMTQKKGFFASLFKK